MPSSTGFESCGFRYLAPRMRATYSDFSKILQKLGVDARNALNKKSNSSAPYVSVYSLLRMLPLKGKIFKLFKMFFFTL